VINSRIEKLAPRQRLAPWRLLGEMIRLYCR
jgi:hypothetical protein